MERYLAESEAKLRSGLAQELARTPATRHLEASPTAEITAAIRLLKANGYAVTKL